MVRLDQQFERLLLDARCAAGKSFASSERVADFIAATASKRAGISLPAALSPSAKSVVAAVSSSSNVASRISPASSIERSRSSSKRAIQIHPLMRYQLFHLPARAERPRPGHVLRT